MLVWGGVGTHMDVELPLLLGEWATTLSKKKFHSNQTMLLWQGQCPGGKHYTSQNASFLMLWGCAPVCGSY
jgi:hypothetical protein